MQHLLIQLHLRAACAPFHLLGRVATPNCCYPATSQSALRLPLIGIAVSPNQPLYWARQRAYYIVRASKRYEAGGLGCNVNRVKQGAAFSGNERK